MESKQDHPSELLSKVHYLDFRDKKLQDSKAALDSLKENQAGAYQTIAQEILSSKPVVPVYCVRPNSLKQSAQWFLEKFKRNIFASDVLYSVKSNPDVIVLKHLYDAGIRHFDVASLDEIKTVRRLFGESVSMYFMHPVKPREAIRAAYFDFGIRDFSLDSLEELEKIKEETKDAKDLGVHVRLSIPNAYAAIDLSGKFGILPSESVPLLRKSRSVAKRLGVCFHVGSQCMEPTEYRNAIMVVKEVLEQSNVPIEVLNVGGGFPSSYPGMIPPDLGSYMDEIFDAIGQLGLGKECQIWCEPGRAMVAEAVSLVVRVDARKKNMLYINDGTYGGLFDAGFPGFVYHAKAIRSEEKEKLSETIESFGFYGPTCDSLDTMKGPFYLPENIAEGDYIEIGQMGAYSRSIRTDFNGFHENMQIEVSDQPLVTMYSECEEEEKKIIS